MKLLSGNTTNLKNKISAAKCTTLFGYEKNTTCYKRKNNNQNKAMKESSRDSSQKQYRVRFYRKLIMPTFTIPVEIVGVAVKPYDLTQLVEIVGAG